MQILAALDIVRQGADVMPRAQLNQVIDAELGPDWSSKLISFDYEPLAAASIGQVRFDLVNFFYLVRTKYCLDLRVLRLINLREYVAGILYF